MADYTAGLARAAVLCRWLALQGRNCGQNDLGPVALEAAADVIEAEADHEVTPPTGTVRCALCGSPIPA